MGRTTRRAFLIGGGVVLAGVAAGLLWGLRDPAEYGESWVLGDDEEDGKKVLVAYASRGGATAGIAHAIGERLGALGWAVDVAPAEDIAALVGYDAVVLGSGIRMGQAYRPAGAFASRFADELAGLPTAAFGVCLSAASPDEESRAEAASYAQALGDSIGAGMVAAMPGVHDPETLAPIIRFMFAQPQVQEGLTLLPPGDYCDWEMAAAWAAEVSEKLG